MGTISIPLTQGKYAIVDEEDADVALVKWHLSCQRRYAAHDLPYVRGQHRKSVYLHRMILARMLGRPMLSTEYTDHIDGNGLDNRRANLRLATQSQNMANREVSGQNPSGYRGVYWSKDKKKWEAKTKHKKQQRHLGYYQNAEDAARAYDKSAKSIWGEFARLNFPAEVTTT